MKCPVCNGENDPGTARCACGHIFEGSPAEVSDSSDEFHARLESLRHRVTRPTRKREDRTKSISAYIRYGSWLISAIAFVVLLNVTTKDPATELARAVFISALVAMVVLALAELLILAVQKLLK